MPVDSHVCASDLDGLRWASDIRAEWVAHGWQPATN
jgi:hypothetical protein